MVYDNLVSVFLFFQMSDDERELENDLDSEVTSLWGGHNTEILRYILQNEEAENLSHLSDSDKRAHHNALERKRRDHIKDSFNGLKDAIPTLQVRSIN